MERNVSPQILELLESTLNGEVKNFSIHVHDSNKKGEGYLGEMCFVSLKSKISDESYHFVIKQAFVDEKMRNMFFIRNNFVNEINFYGKIWPCLDKFQNDAQVTTKFDKITRCYAMSAEEGNEKLVFENLRYENFQTLDKRKAFDKEHVEYILKQYGRFHGTSFAYKNLNPEGYLQIIKDQQNLQLKFITIKTFRDVLKSVQEICLEGLHPEEDAKIIEKLRYYVENGPQIYADSCTYKGKYLTITHGDCWSNNMMFKYNESGKLVDMRLIDFQFCHEASPASDLSYCLYSGGSKELFDQLDYYLKLYHDSLVETLGEFGCSANVYPFQELKRDWKRHCKYGMLMSLLLWRGKVTYEDHAVDLTDLKEEDSFANEFIAAKCDEETYRKVTRDIVVHMYENDFL